MKPMTAMGQGWRWTKSAQRVQALMRVRPAARLRWIDSLSTLKPRNPSSAGSSVNAAATATSTAIEVPTARP